VHHLNWGKVQASNCPDKPSHFSKSMEKLMKLATLIIDASELALKK